MYHSVFHQIDSLLTHHLPEPHGKQLPSWNQRVPAPEVISFLPRSLFLLQPLCGGSSVTVLAPWEQPVQWEEPRSIALAKQGQQVFVYASAPLVAKSSLKARHKGASEETDNPPPLFSLTCHDYPKLAGSVSASRAVWLRNPARETAAAGAARLPSVCLIIQITAWVEIRAGTGNTNFVLLCSCSSVSLQVVNIPCRIHLGCSSQQPDQRLVTPLSHRWGCKHLSI